MFGVCISPYTQEKVSLRGLVSRHDKIRLGGSSENKTLDFSTVLRLTIRVFRRLKCSTIFHAIPIKGKIHVDWNVMRWRPCASYSTHIKTLPGTPS